MKDLAENNFGLIIAFLLPGFILLYGLSYSSSAIGSWLAKSSSTDSLTVGGFLYSTLASLALGLIVSAARWLIIDTVLKWMGVRDQGLDFGKLKEKDTLAAFSEVIANHYRYYQYYANTLVAVAGAFVVYLADQHGRVRWTLWVGVLSLVLVLFLGSRDALTKYFVRAEQILGRREHGRVA